MRVNTAHTSWRGLLGGGLILLLLQLPLILNPGWFSHDELQWAARAAVAHWSDLPWVAWSDVGTFQYRPLTFNLWLLLAHGLNAHPFVLHGAFVALGSLNAWLLARVLQAAGCAAGVAMTAMFVFVLSPCVVYVHGWIGTLGDLLVLAAGLLGLRAVQRASCATPADTLRAALLPSCLVTLALLAKESAIVLPIILLAALYRHPRPRGALLPIALTGIPVLGYLALRLPALWSIPAGNASYAWAVGHIPQRLAEYLLYPFLPPLFEIAPVLSKSPARLLLATGCVVLMLGVLATRGWRWPVAWLALVAAALGPVLMLPISYNQYAYLASAMAVGGAAMAWPALARVPRGVLVLLAAIVVVHGLGVMQRMRAVGVIQQHFDADWQALRARHATLPCLSFADPDTRWMVQRFVHDVPRYAGICLAADGTITALQVQRDGHLTPLAR